MMKVLVRMPNWLGDMVMASAFIRQLPLSFPGAQIDVIVKKGLDGLAPLLPGIHKIHVFDKKTHPGLTGAWKFGKSLRQAEYDLFFCLPNSISSAIMAKATKSKKRVGYGKEGRSLLFTHSYPIPKNQHRVWDYLQLLRLFTNNEPEKPKVIFNAKTTTRKGILVNFNSEASSRRLTKQKAIALINELQQATDEPITLMGAPNEAAFVSEVHKELDNKSIENLAGKTSLPQLAQLMAASKAMLSTDSGPAHLSNAVGTNTIVLFGAGDENHTAPFNVENRTIIRLNELDCEPCRRNECKRFETPQCLERLNNTIIINEVLKGIHDV